MFGFSIRAAAPGLARSLQCFVVWIAFAAAATLSAQTVCDGRNHLSLNFSGGFGVAAGEAVAVRYVAPSRFAAEALSVFMPFDIGGGLGQAYAIAEVRAHDISTTLPGAVVARGEFAHAPATPGWHEARFERPIVIDPTLLYWLTLRAPVGGNVRFLAYEDVPAGPDPTTHAIDRGAGWVDGLTPFRFKIRLTSSDCSDGPSAAVVPFGSGCSGPAALAPRLSAPILPVVGVANFALLVEGTTPGSVVELWWASALAPSPVLLSSNCATQLAPQPLLMAFTAGLNPIFRAPSDQLGEARFAFGLPTALSTRGISLGVQALVFDPAGVSIGSTTIALSETLDLQLGY